MNEIIKRRQEAVRKRKAKEKRQRGAMMLVSRIHKMSILDKIDKWNDTKLCLDPIEKIAPYDKKKAYYRRYYTKNKKQAIDRVRQRRLRAIEEEREKVIEKIDSNQWYGRKQERLNYRLVYLDRMAEKAKNRLKAIRDKEQIISKAKLNHFIK